MDDAWGTIEEITKWLDGGSTLGPLGGAGRALALIFHEA